MKLIDDNAMLEKFDPWSGAVNTKASVVEAGKAKEFDYLIGELYPDGLTPVQLNDILWFDSNWVFESLGMTPEEVEEEE